MFIESAIALLLAASPTAPAPADCNDGDAQVQRARSLTLHAEPLRVPWGPAGRHAPTHRCVRIAFRIDARGVPVKPRVEISSVSRVVDRVAVAAVARSRFDAARAGQDETFALVFFDSE